jgi:hypothetical protein
MNRHTSRALTRLIILAAVLAVAYFLMTGNKRLDFGRFTTRIDDPSGPARSIPVKKSTPVSLPAGVEEIPLPAGYGARGAWYEVYFTSPVAPLAPQQTGGVDGPLAAAIDEARVSVMSHYSA